MKNICKFILVILLLAGLIFCLIFLNKTENIATTKDYIKINNTVLNLIISDTQPLRELGLSGRNSLENDVGMIFIFPLEDYYGFWMKDMNFPIDILWIDNNKIIVDELSNVSPSTFPKVFRPKQKSLYVLETNAGFFEKNAIQIGDKVEFLKK